jgi:hypothetical protein
MEAADYAASVVAVSVRERRARLGSGDGFVFCIAASDVSSETSSSGWMAARKMAAFYCTNSRLSMSNAALPW